MKKLPFIFENEKEILEIYDEEMINEITEKLKEMLINYPGYLDFRGMAEKIYYGEWLVSVDELAGMILGDWVELYNGYGMSLCSGNEVFISECLGGDDES